MDQIELEKRVMEMLLAGNEPVFLTLQKQYVNSTITDRIFTGAGFYTQFRVSTNVPRLMGVKNTFELTDVDAGIGKLYPAINFNLFIKEGYIDFLEGVTVRADKWPNDYAKLALRYNYPSGRRDINLLKKRWT